MALEDSSAADDASEQGTTVCDNGLDDDGDGRVDVKDDYGCESPTDWSEHSSLECDDGIDNDGDGKTDWPRDPECLTIAWTPEG